MLINRKCQQCEKLFYARPVHINKGWGKYCSTKCQYESFKNGTIVKCSICGKEAYRTLLHVARSKSGKFFCDKSCQTKWRNKEFSGKKSIRWKDGHATYRDAMLGNSVPKICKMCKEKDARVLAVHHIDQNRKNYKVENLAWLCHNCHHLVHSEVAEKLKFSKIIQSEK
ncbi:MAG: HNH endonuclease signature motif containing protein [Patescibacteria group bacterium]